MLAFLTVCWACPDGRSGGERKRLVAVFRGRANKAALAAALVLSRPPAALAWSVTFGGCSFSDGPAQELVRTGSCASQSGTLQLCGASSTVALGCPARSNKIESLPAGVFDDMGAVE